MKTSPAWKPETSQTHDEALVASYRGCWLSVFPDSCVPPGWSFSVEGPERRETLNGDIVGRTPESLATAKARAQQIADIIGVDVNQCSAPNCGRTLEPQTRGRPRKYCSAACRSAVQRAKAKDANHE